VEVIQLAELKVRDGRFVQEMKQRALAVQEAANVAASARFAYRPEVDGLRAVAVVPVVLFHAGFALFPGGYIGVDVFFVISGYLITSIILAEQSRGHFSIAAFYERRARRILPALFLVMLVSLPFAWWWMTPHHFKGFAQSVVATTLFAPNIYFLLKSSYFDIDVDEKPLLHTWSLGVEEQYYIVFPWLVVACHRFGPRVLAGVVAATAVVSLGASEWASWTHPIGNFYLAPTRAWELALGALLAIAARHGFPRTLPGARWCNTITLLALAMIVAPIFLYQQHTRFPGLHALPPTLGAALIIAFARADTLVGRLLSWRWSVGLGLVSYSLYLWHQPIFALARLHSSGKPALWVFGVLSVVSLALAYGTWRFVERPFRDRHRFERRQIFALAFAGSLAFCAFGLLGHFGEGLPGRLKPEQLHILAFGDRPETPRDNSPGAACFLTPEQGAAALGRCVENEAATGRSLFLWGDSHAAHLYAGLRRQLAGTAKFSYLTASACPPLVGVDADVRAGCYAINQAILARIVQERPDRVILAAVWGNYDWRPLGATLEALKAAGIAQVEVVGPVPRWNPSLPVVLARFGVGFGELPERTELGLDPSTRQLDSELRRFVERRGATYVSPYGILCNAEGCLVRVGATVDSMMQWDVSHLTRRGSEFLVSRFHP